ncbi:hypothetical protein PDJAM_G00137170 [Pangasius djambal]|uniref:Uncharacterized protein n=1 Tax=Pangasius djambal TaxID=1691987 RepID=A0ACC5ZDZ7_9TELE|nr:hypothetical protein [Pangasius djambal]
MADGYVSYPSVFVVDSGTKLPPLPPKPGQTRIQNRRNRQIQNILLVLVCLALIGLLVEGCFIYYLHWNNKTSEDKSDNPQTEARRGPNEENPITKKPKLPTILHPSKPLAHLTAGDKKPKKDGIMEWKENGDSILYGLIHRDGKLIVQKEGYYYVYSKLSYSAEGPPFIQMVKKNTTRYLGNSITLLTYYRHNSNSVHKGSMRSSFLGGVFHLYKEDAVFVHVNNGTLVRLHNSADNFFGMFML